MAFSTMVFFWSILTFANKNQTRAAAASSVPAKAAAYMVREPFMDLSGFFVISFIISRPL